MGAVAAERVAVATVWMARVLSQRIAEGGIGVAAPIQTRIFQMLSEVRHAGDFK